MLTRKKFVQFLGLGSVALVSSFLGIKNFLKRRQYNFPLKISGANFKAGHLLRESIKEIPTETVEIETVIVGGGISGLSAGWYFKKNNYNNFLILEMDGSTGGNSKSGKNNVSEYPYGAHYVPIPSEEASYVKELFLELGIIQGFKNDLPIYNEYYLCADPHERLYFQGYWQDGLIPARGVQEEDKRQYKEFFSFIEFLKTAKGNDGRSLFAIPMEKSSKDPEWLQLDQMSMYQYMEQRGWNSRYLNWYVEYSCRDDYGVSHRKVSAWAGLHYFASRAGKAANADSQTVLTWPSGNGFLVQKLSSISKNNIQTDSLVYRIEKEEKSKTFSVDSIHPDTKKTIRYKTKNVIYASPRYTAKKVIAGYDGSMGDNLDFTPWLIANITFSERPLGHGVPISWDNVSFYSKSLGYIVANQQDLTTNRKEVVVTYYLPLDEEEPKKERLKAYLRTKEDWEEIILADLEKMHTGISELIQEIDLWIWGHGMVSPGINFLWSSARQKILTSFKGIEFANSDMSGISIFEEAQYRGCEAAKKILLKLKR